MKIETLECWIISFELDEPFQIAYETICQFDNVIMKATTDRGITGWSCAAPDQFVTGETAESVQVAFADTIEPLLKGSEPFRYANINVDLQTNLAQQRSAMAMADMVLYDLMAKSADQPLYKFLGGFRDSILTSVTIGIMPLSATVERAKHCVRQGFRCLKLKGGLDVDEDIEKTLRVREAIGDDIQLRFDANQGYSVAEALTYIRQASHLGVELFEQPTSSEFEEHLATLVGRSTIPVMADESLTSLHDVFRLARNDRADMINIKLMKVGGITEATHINSVARSASLPSMIGCLEECELGIAFGLHFCLAHPNLMYADLDSAIDIRHDPFRGLVKIEQGVMHPLGDRGIGDPRFD